MEDKGGKAHHIQKGRHNVQRDTHTGYLTSGASGGRFLQADQFTEDPKKRVMILKKATEAIVKNEGFKIVVVLDESIFVYDSVVRKVWIYRDERSIVKVTGSHQRTRVFGALSKDRRQIFRQYDDFDADTFLAYLKELHRKFPRMILFMDRARQHLKSKRVKEYLEKHGDSIIVVCMVS